MKIRLWHQLWVIVAVIVMASSGCELLRPSTTLRVGDTTVTIGYGSVALYGTVWQSPLDSSTLARLRAEGYRGSSEKAPVSAAEVIVRQGGQQWVSRSDGGGRYVMVLPRGRYAVEIVHARTIRSDTVVLDIDQNMERDWTVRPAEEFRFPLAVGNKWVYAYEFSNSSRRGKGTETWEVLKTTGGGGQTEHFIQLSGQGIDEFPQQQPYSYTIEFKVIETAQYYLVQYSLAASHPPDTLWRLQRNAKDTLTLSSGGGTSITVRSYLSGIGHLSFYSDGGSPGSGRFWVQRRLQSFQLK
jgi:hypothetical protein